MLSIQHIKLRRLLHVDLPMVLEWRNQKQVRVMMKDDHVISQYEHRMWFTFVEKSSNCEWFIVQYDGKDVGVLGITNIDKRYNTCTWSMYLSPLMIGTGVGVLIEICAIDYMLFNHKIKKIWGELLSTNQGLLNLHKLCGFKVNRINKNKLKRGEELVDIIEVSMHSSGWSKRREDIIMKYGLN
ncbi:UDP-4-amino-4,6-dideoxy-N-acetyl-beta-L-altrosamine N-acetyltransferase [Candidatus Woesearchaeota archaeon]|jgi:UDP-4-amino-4,6-dideoxy-N-acetyl-beta-L-altrosamine N-acetyltransferase|nr:UDP-4-amino-4,6-dideoxy-N-acetyl-beta-L-altrosamine N-acetyltransferase [Candidatus Woesearchaeota archaeon]MBT4764605.1 UDP-4-amino-4,6-dideoxy-N-acetyl-beta-L-altrosamine N-acetyltransferase [bacterium]